MKSLSNIVLRKPNLHFVYLFALLAACGTSPAHTATPTVFNQTPISITTATQTPLPPFQYTVFSGDTCAQIAFNFNVSEQTIIELNNLLPSCLISPGQKLLIPYPTVSNIPTSTPQPVEIVEIATTLDFNRNGKKYIVTIATSHFILINRDLYDSLTPPPKIPEKPSDSIMYRAKIKEISDLDNDGEQEYTVLLNECKDWECADYVSYIKIYKYNPEKDEYYVFDEFQTDPEEIGPTFSF